MLLLFWNGMWGVPPDTTQPLPAGWEMSTDRRRFDEAAGVVFHLPDLRLPASLRKAPGQLWVAWSMECEAHYPRQRDPAFLRDFDLTMTHRQDADVWAPYVHPGLLAELRTPAAPKTAAAPAVAFVSGTLDRSGRGALLDGLMEHLAVDSYGRRRRNRELDADRGRATKLETIGRYRFTLAFENAVAEDYVTEKLFDPLVAGSVPVYLGAPNAAAFAPGEGCFVDARAFPSPAALAAHLRALAADEDAYRALLAWKGRPLRPEFLALVARVGEGPIPRLCRLLAARIARRGGGVV